MVSSLPHSKESDKSYHNIHVALLKMHAERFSLNVYTSLFEWWELKKVVKQKTCCLLYVEASKFFQLFQGPASRGRKECELWGLTTCVCVPALLSSSWTNLAKLFSSTYFSFILLKCEQQQHLRGFCEDQSKLRYIKNLEDRLAHKKWYISKSYYYYSRYVILQMKQQRKHTD